MRTLAIDTSGLACSIVLLERREILAERHETLGRGHAERLIPWVAGLPDGGRADRIVAGCGPGSFTGVRIGLAAAKGLALGWGVPVFGVSSMALLAAPFVGKVTIARQAGHGELFVQNFASGVSHDEVRSLTPGDAAAYARHSIVVGSGSEALVAARGWGEAIEGEGRASSARLFESFGIAEPIYGRGADARPMAVS